MPGIVGIINKHNKYNSFHIDQMLETMRHESFYSSGSVSYEELGTYIGWVVHKNSLSDCLPIYNETKDIILIFSGEDFQDRHVIDELKRKMHHFEDYNFSYLIHLYEENRETFYNKLNGKFHGIIIDKNKNLSILFNDRFGFQRMYYCETKEAFIFSTEAKAILKICPECKSLRMDSLGQFFSYNCVLENNTLFKDVFLLPSASKWVISKNGNIKKETYFQSCEWESLPAVDDQSLNEQVHKTIISILPKYFYPEKDIGFSLTGGFDTRIILANRKNSPGLLPCYTFGGMYRDCYDVKVARKIAVACNQNHQTIRLDKAFLTNFPNLAAKTIYITDGAFDLTGAQNLYVNRLAREIAPIRMTGNYGQEVFQSYTAFRPNQSNLELFEKEFISNIFLANEVYKEAVRCHKLTFTLFKQAPWFQYGNYVLENSQLIVRSPFMDNELVRIMYQAPQDRSKNRNISYYLINNGQNSELQRIITDRGFLGSYPSIFSKFARIYYEFSFKMEYYSNYGLPKSLSKANLILEGLRLNRLFIERHKYHHLGLWLKNELSNYVKSILLDSKFLNRPYINKNQIKILMNKHFNGLYNYTAQINKLITSELIQQVLIEV